VAGIAGALGGTLELGVTDAAATGILPRAFTVFHRAHPAVEVRVAVHATSGLVSLLRERRIDLGLGTLPGGGDPLPLPTRALDRERLHLVAPAAEGGSAAAEALELLPFIAYPAGSNTRRVVDDALAGAGLVPRISMEIGRPDVMIRLVEAGVGVSVLPASLVMDRVRVLDPPGFAPGRSLGLILPPGEPEPLAAAFVACLPDPPGDQNWK
jgi:DNA-binding transcriptional LysR family regulator